MRAERRYRGPVDSTGAVAEIERTVGQFDPDVVNALAELVAFRSASAVA